MTKNIKLLSYTRKEKAINIRKQSKIPAIFYGKDKENKSIEVDYHDFRRVFEKAGYNTILELSIDDKETTPVIIHEVDMDPVKDTFMHIDFYAIRMDQKITAKIPVKIIGISKAVKDLGGILIHNKDEIEIKCLPKDLIQEIKIDISDLDDFHSSIQVKNLDLNKAITIVDDKDSVIVSVSAPRSALEEEEETKTAEPETKKSEE